MNKSLCWIVLVSCALFSWNTASALSLGEIRIQSSLGQPLRAQIPVRLAPGEELSTECVSATNNDPFSADPIAVLPGVRVSVHQASGGRGVLSLSSQRPVDDPATRVLLKITCGGEGALFREYTLLLDPPLRNAPAPIELPIAPPPPPTYRSYPDQVFNEINEYTVQQGDTLSSIAQQRYPNNTAQQRRLRQAIAAANSDVLPSEDSALPTAGTPLLIPQLAEAAAPARPKARRSRPAGVTTARRAPRAPQSLADALPPSPPAPDATIADAPLPPATPKAAASTPKTARRSADGSRFVLRLSRSALDLDTSRPISDAERAALRERQNLLNADDLTANMLALQHEMRQMKAEIAELKSQLQQQAAGAVPPAPGAVGAAQPAPEVVGATQPAPEVVGATQPAPVTAAPADPAAQPKPPVEPVVAAAAPVGPAADTPAETWLDRLLRGMPGWWWLLPLIALAALIAAFIKRRRAAQLADAEAFVDTVPQPTRQAVGSDSGIPTVEKMVPAPAQAETVRGSAVDVSTPTDKAPRSLSSMQARYLQSRFPDLHEAGFDLSDADAVVEKSRVYFMEDGAADKAIELLEYSMSQQPKQRKIWLALLEIYRQMKMKGAFEKLARVVQQRSPEPELWRKVAAIGRALDPKNEFYAEETSEQQGSAEVLDLALDDSSKNEPGKAQNWLDIPLDFTPTLRADELRNALLADLPDVRSEPTAAQPKQDSHMDFDLDIDLDDQAMQAADRVEPKLTPKPLK